jgi:hypothetical protein
MVQKPIVQKKEKNKSKSSKVAKKNRTTIKPALKMKRGRPLKSSSFSKLQSAIITMAEISQNDFEKSTDRRMKEKLNKTVQAAEENTNVVNEILQLSHVMPQHNAIQNSHISKDE